MNDSPTTHWSWVAMAAGSGGRAPASSAAAPHAALTSGGLTGDTPKSRRVTSTTPAGRWKFSSKVTELRLAAHSASARCSARSAATHRTSWRGRQNRDELRAADDAARGAFAVSAPTGIPRDHRGPDSAADVELADHGQAPRLQRLHQFVEDLVGRLLEEMALVTERPEVELERLELDAEPVRRVEDDDGAE